MRNFLLSVGLAVATLIGAELTFRVFLFSSCPVAKRFRDPWRYASYFSDDAYWYLYDILDGHWKPPTRPDPLLGWRGSFGPDPYVHEDAGRIGRRRPVLLYGASYAHCATPKCFQDYLNGESGFADRCYMLNYGTAGFGPDQSYLLLRKTIDRFRNPIVIFSLTTEDLDRTVLSYRIGQKPRFALGANGELRLAGPGIDPDPTHFRQTRAFHVDSYLWRLVINGGVLPPWLSDKLRGERRINDEKIALTKAILTKSVEELRRRHLDFFFLVFVPNWVGVSWVAQGDDWRLDAIVSALGELRAPYLVTRDILRADMRRTGRPVENYFRAEDSHPSEMQNELIVSALRDRLGVCYPGSGAKYGAIRSE